MPEFSKQFSAIWEVISEPLFKLGSNEISVLSLALALLIVYLSFKLSRVGEKFVGKLLKKTELDTGVRGSIESFTRYFIITTGFLITLDTIGVSLTSLAAVGAVLMVGIGFGLQNITQNFISGLILLIERPIKRGDLVQVEGTTGRVTEIRARSTIITTREDVSIIVPNSQFISEQVVNESYSGENIRLKILVGVAYGSDVSLVRDILAQVASGHQSLLKNPKPFVVFEDFGESSLDFSIRAWTHELWTVDQIKSDIRFEICAQFAKHGIEIPFPQRDIHIKNPSTFNIHTSHTSQKLNTPSHDATSNH